MVELKLKSIKLPIGTIDVRETSIPCTALYKVGDKLVILPKYERILNEEHRIELHKKGVVGEIIDMSQWYIIIGEKEKYSHCGRLTIKTATETFNCHPNFYLLGYKIID